MDDFKILVVDDEIEFRDVYKIILEDKGYETVMASSGEECLTILKAQSFDLVLTDLKMEGISGIDLLKKIKENQYTCEVLLVTGFGSVESAVSAMKLGAFGYFVKGSDPEVLIKEIEKLVKIKQLERDNILIRNKLIQFDYLLDSNNDKFKDVLRVAEKAAMSNANILILGESGTGKEVIAKYIHHVSDRKDGNFVAVNCQVFSEGVIDSELFGHEKGAFTGAGEKRIGRFEEANNGTLFLDEIGELSLNTQVKLLRTLENRTIERIGSNKSISVNIRLLSATNKKINDEIKSGKFREDLYYRINTITIHVPPLRERKEDLPMLINFFLNQMQNEMKKKIIKAEDGLMDLLTSYNYPGNIRELKNIIERLVVLSDNGIIRKNDLPELKNLGDEENIIDENVKSLKEVRQLAEIKYIKSILNNCNGNISEAAKVMDISRRQLFNKLVEYGIKE
ncbi:MAG: two component, sigma54 specific, transcriptional regulator, Fis family [Bacillota bacterium]|nr:two component, sigma54 specific, transcriptional regulator, Fis family [Bacillota bacterium]